MKALLLAAGKATRLGELSQETPKCLLPMGDEVLLDRLIRQLRAVGVTEFLINTHHLADQISRHIQRRDDRETFSLVYEPQLLGTLGTLRANRSFFGSSPGWVLHADNFISGTLHQLKAKFESRPPDCLGVMLTFETHDPTSCGVVEVNERQIVTTFVEKVHDPPSLEASAATFILDDEALSQAAQLLTGTDLSRDFLPTLVNRIMAVHHAGVVVDVGTPQGLTRAQRMAEGVQ